MVRRFRCNPVFERTTHVALSPLICLVTSVAVLLVTTAAIGALPALGRAKARPKPAGQVVIGLSQEPTVFDPRRPHIEVDDGVNIALYSPLWAVAPSGEMLPQLALEVPTVANGGLSADGLTWSIKLRPA